VTQRVQQDTYGHRGRSGDPLYRVRRICRTCSELLTTKQTARLEAVFAAEEHIAVEVAWWVGQQIITAYAQPRPTARQDAASPGDQRSVTFWIMSGEGLQAAGHGMTRCPVVGDLGGCCHRGRGEC
jgi:hypothetical protein